MEHLTLDKLPVRVQAKLDVENMFMASRVIIAAERLELFRRLDGTSLSVDSIRKVLRVRSSRLGFFLDALVSLGLLRKSGGEYSNTRMAEKYFIRERSIHWTRQYPIECIETYKELAALEETLTSNKTIREILGKDEKNYLDEMRENPRQAENFTRMLYHYHRQDAEALAEAIDLSGYEKLLDVGGGSGVMSMALVRKFPRLNASVLDIEPVCRIARRIIKEEGLATRINTVVGDMRKPLPRGYDVIMFCDVGGLDRRYIRNAFKCLPGGGMIILVDRFANEERTEPLDRLLHQLTTSNFSMATRNDVMDLLRTCGFGAVKSKKLYEDVLRITGRKPGRVNSTA